MKRKRACALSTSGAESAERARAMCWIAQQMAQPPTRKPRRSSSSRKDDWLKKGPSKATVVISMGGSDARRTHRYGFHAQRFSEGSACGRSHASCFTLHPHTPRRPSRPEVAQLGASVEMQGTELTSGTARRRGSSHNRSHLSAASARRPSPPIRGTSTHPCSSPPSI